MAVLAVTVPATAYVVSETVVDEPATASRQAVTLAASREPQAPAAGTNDQGAGAADPRGTADEDSCDDDDHAADDAGDDDADDDVSVVRPCTTELQEDGERDLVAGSDDDRDDVDADAGADDDRDDADD